MTQKLDYYKVLGLDTTASADAIKRAHQKLVMKYHPDRMISKPEDEKAAAAKIFAEITEAANILTDADKRRVYDDYGHEGLARHANGNTPSSRPNYADIAGPPTVREKLTEGELFDFFEKRAGRGGGAPSSTSPAPVSADRASAAEERRRQREARRNGGAAPAPVSAPEAPARAAAPAMPADDFNAVREGVQQVSARLAQINQPQSAQVPLDKLEAFRDAVRDMLTVLDAAIARAPKNGGPKF